MGTVLITIHVLISALLMIVVLLQSSKGGGLAGAFGGSGGMGAIFGSRGTATFLSKLTTVLAVLFMLSCIGQSLYSRAGSGGTRTSIVREELSKRRTASPAASLPGIPKTGQAETQQPQPEAAKPPAEEEKK